MPIILKRKLRSIGGSIAVVIPADIVDVLKLTTRDELEFYMNNGDVLIRKAAKTSR
jgi:antitoxin component of MazEF toxin-antitoxin module